MIKWFERRWKKKIPDPYRDCTQEELDEHEKRLKEEFALLIQNQDYTIEELIAFLDKNGELLDAIEYNKDHHL